MDMCLLNDVFKTEYSAFCVWILNKYPSKIPACEIHLVQSLNKYLYSYQSVKKYNISLITAYSQSSFYFFTTQHQNKKLAILNRGY